MEFANDNEFDREVPRMISVTSLGVWQKHSSMTCITNKNSESGSWAQKKKRKCKTTVLLVDIQF